MSESETIRPRLLLVDDEVALLESVQVTLRRDYEVIVAHNSEEGLACLARESNLHVIVADYKMPGLDGIAFLSLVCQLAPQTVRILLTGNAELGMAIDAVNDGHIFRFLTKPCPIPVLRRALADAFEQARLVTADRELLQAKLKELTSLLVHAERLAMLGTLAGGVGHELNNILHVYTMLLDFMQTDAAKGVPLDKEHLAELWRVRDHLSLHARGLLELGRPARGEPEALELAALVLKTLDTLRSVGKTKRVNVVPELATKAVYVRAERAHLEQVLINLVGNAVDAMDENSISRESTLRVRIASEKDTAFVSLCDNGPGMGAPTLARIFEPYFTTKPAGKGTGLGLPVVKQIVESYGGELTVQTELGQGSCFTFSLPLCQEPYRSASPRKEMGS